jgi:phage gpG-like protein
MTNVRFTSAGFEPFTLRLDRFSDNLQDAEPAFEAIATYQVEVVNKRQFRQQGSVEVGGAWAPLSPPYARWKAKRRPGKPILVFDGDLRDSLTIPGDGVWEVWHRGFVIGTAVEYATYHQNGTPNMPARPVLGSPRKSDVRAMTKILQRWIVEGVANARP